MLKYLVIEGLRKNSNLIYVECEKQLYRKNCQTKKFSVYKCREKHCKSRVKIDLQSKECTKVENFQQHNHPEQEKEFKKMQIVAKIKRECADPRIPKYRGFAVANTRQVFEENITEFQVDSDIVDYSKMQRNLLRIRQNIIKMKDENNDDAKTKHPQPIQEHSQGCDNTKMQRSLLEMRQTIKCETEESNTRKDRPQQPEQEESHYGAEDNSSDEEKDFYEDDDESNHFDVFSDPLADQRDAPEESNKIPSTSAACSSSVVEHVKDEHQMAGQLIGAKIKNMDLHQQIIAEKLISDVLYYGRLGMLEINTRLQNLKLSPT